MCVIDKKGMRRGSTTLFVAVSLAGILTLSAFVIDAAGAYVTQARLQNFADAGADAGGTELSDKIVEYAMAREPNPPDGADPRDYLTEEDRQDILADSSITQIARNYVEQNRAIYGITLDTVDVRYPVNPVLCGDPTAVNAEIQVDIKKNQSFVLGRLLNGEEGTNISASAIRFIRLCPIL